MVWFSKDYSEEQIEAVKEQYSLNPTNTILYLKGVAENRALEDVGIERSGNRQLIKKLQQL